MEKERGERLVLTQATAHMHNELDWKIVTNLVQRGKCDMFYLLCSKLSPSSL